MWKFVIGFILGFLVATYGVKNTIDLTQGWVDNGKQFIEKHSDDIDSLNSKEGN